ncbi:MAG: hypothetical protein Kow0013_21830 [Pararhodobacter sp.]
MRPSNKRSRSKNNRPRSLGNIVNRVFDSSGPEGKVRGTPQQIIDKYTVLARDAQLAGDRVAAENFTQHAEHYTRMLNEAQAEQAREAEARREQQQQHDRNRRNDTQRDGSDGDGGDSPSGNQNGNQNGAQSGAQDGGDSRSDGRSEGRGDWKERRNSRRGNRREAGDPRGDVEVEGDGDSMLVETPESQGTQRTDIPTEAPPQDAPADAGERKPKPRARTRKPKAEKVEAPAEAAPGGEGAEG